MLLALIILTQLDGSPIWIESNQIQVILPPRRSSQHSCRDNVGAAIRVGSTGFCVIETPEQILKLIRENK